MAGSRSEDEFERKDSEDGQEARSKQPEDNDMAALIDSSNQEQPEEVKDESSGSQIHTPRTTDALLCTVSDDYSSDTEHPKRHSPPHFWQPGRLLFLPESWILWNLLFLTFYGVAALGFAVYVSTCPTVSGPIKALAGWNIRVDQFYSGITLSVALTPVAIMIRKLAFDLALVLPFAVPSMRPTYIVDVDRFMDPGIFATMRLFKYHKVLGFTQGFLLLVGSLLVPVGTLMVFPGTYAAPRDGRSAVAMPIVDSSQQPLLAVDMQQDSQDWLYSPNPFFSPQQSLFFSSISSTFFGNLIEQAGNLSATLPVLGPKGTTNLTYEEGVRYNGIVTFSWESKCQYTDNITYSGSQITFSGAESIYSPSPYKIYGFNSTGSVGGLSILNSYFAVIGASEEVTNLDEALASGAIVQVGNNTWISRVVCTPLMPWQVSSCLWSNNSMTDCQNSTAQNGIKLDKTGLDNLSWYLGALPLLINSANAQGINGLDRLALALLYDPQDNMMRRAPTAADFDKMYGLIAQAIVSIATSGFFGVAEVPTSGSTPRPVYLVRTYILGIVVSMVNVVPFLTLGLLFWSIKKHVPLRRATLLTVASAFRGKRWDDELAGDCVMTHGQLRERHAGEKVMFGEDVDTPGYVGFAAAALPVRKDGLYGGGGQ